MKCVECVGAHLCFLQYSAINSYSVSVSVTACPAVLFEMHFVSVHVYTYVSIGLF